MKRAAIESSLTKILLIDSSKFGRVCQSYLTTSPASTSSSPIRRSSHYQDFILEKGHQTAPHFDGVNRAASPWIKKRPRNPLILGAFSLVAAVGFEPTTLRGMNTTFLTLVIIVSYCTRGKKLPQIVHKLCSGKQRFPFDRLYTACVAVDCPIIIHALTSPPAYPK